MDPDGLSILAALIIGAVAILLAFFAGALCADDEEKVHETCLGFSNLVAGVGVAFVFVCAVFVFGWFYFSPHLVWQGALALLLVLVLCVAAFALGFVKGQPGSIKWLFYPVGLIFAAPAKLLFRAAHLSAVSDVTEEDVLSMMDDVEEQALIDETQKEMITNIFELDDVTAGDIMTHRTEIISVADTDTAADVVRMAAEQGMSRMPVYHKSMDDIVGIVYVKDLFNIWDNPEKSTRPVCEFMRAAMFVPEACRARELLIDFKKKRTQIAVVVDEYGGTSGLVTMEDVLEEMVGNIQDEFDNEEEDLVRTEDGVLAAGSAEIEDVCKIFDLPLPDDEEEDRDFDSVGGLVIDRLGRIPTEGEQICIAYGGILFEVLEVSDRRVAKIKCTRETAEKVQEDTE